MSTLYRCDSYKECGHSCGLDKPHNEEADCTEGFYCDRTGSQVHCTPMPVADEAITSLESTIDSIIIDELTSQMVPIGKTYPFADVAVRIRTRFLELIST